MKVWKMKICGGFVLFWVVVIIVFYVIRPFDPGPMSIEDIKKASVRVETVLPVTGKVVFISIPRTDQTEDGWNEYGYLSIPVRENGKNTLLVVPDGWHGNEYRVLDKGDNVRVTRYRQKEGTGVMTTEVEPLYLDVHTSKYGRVVSETVEPPPTRTKK